MLAQIHEISIEEYHKVNALSKGALVEFAKSPAHYKAAISEPTPETPALKFGKDFHCAALQPDLFKQQYIVPPEIDRRTKAGKAEYAEFQLMLSQTGRRVISQEDMGLINRMVDSLYSSDVVSGLLNHGKAEQSIFWNHPKWGFLCKCRPDYINHNLKVVVDLKSAVDASPEAFGRAAVKFKYHWQAAHYLQGVNDILPDEYREFVFIVIEKKPPFAIQNYIIKQDDIYLAQEQIKPLLSRYAECLSGDVWPGPPDKIQVLELPGWYIRTALD